MGEKDDGLELSLTLGFSGNRSSLNLTPKSSRNEVFLPSSDRSSEKWRSKTSLVQEGIDVNQSASLEEAGVSSPNSTVSSVSGKKNEREEHQTERTTWSSRAVSDGEDDGSKKKLRLSKDQSAVLEETFKVHSTLNTKQKLALGKQLTLRPRQVEVWFQNRRARTKLKQTEVDCEYLKRCYENLMEENRRLQKEVQELRAPKRSHQPPNSHNPPTTLVMCPSCERISSTSLSYYLQHPVGTVLHRPKPIHSWPGRPVCDQPRIVW